MKITLPLTLTFPLCLIAVLTGCSHRTGKLNGDDSPIIVSDGSTRYHHKSLTESGNQVTVQDTGYSVSYLECPAGKGFTCPNTPLVAGWTLTANDTNGKLIVTVKSQNNNYILADFGSNGIGNVALDLDSENFLGNVVKTNDANLTIQYFTLVNGTGGTSLGPLKCSSKKPCRIKIHYQD